jgi:hypothetical protein
MSVPASCNAVLGANRDMIVRTVVVVSMISKVLNGRYRLISAQSVVDFVGV